MEPDLQPVTTAQLNGASANQQDGTKLDISANGVWDGRFEKTYFDVRVLNPLAPTNRTHGPAGMYKTHEQERKEHMSNECRKWNTHCSLPLVLSATGGVGNETTTFFKYLA